MSCCKVFSRCCRLRSAFNQYITNLNILLQLFNLKYNAWPVSRGVHYTEECDGEKTISTRCNWRCLYIVYVNVGPAKQWHHSDVIIYSDDKCGYEFSPGLALPAHKDNSSSLQAQRSLARSDWQQLAKVSPLSVAMRPAEGALTALMEAHWIYLQRLYIISMVGAAALTLWPRCAVTMWEVVSLVANSWRMGGTR